MTSRAPHLAAALLLAPAFGGCERFARGEESGPEMVVEWTGSDTGRLVGAARVEWCESLGMLEIRAVQGDTGVALAVYPVGAARADTFPVVLPERADTSRPAAAVALRWFAETALRGFQGRTGTVVLERVDERVSGRFHSAVRSVNDGTRLDVRGSFRDVAVHPAARGCPPRRKAEAADSGVD